MIAVITVSPRLYRWHQQCPDFLPTLLTRAAQVITDEPCEWGVREGEGPFLCSEVDFELFHPLQRPIGSQVDWQLAGCATAALIALRLHADQQIERASRDLP